MKLNKVTYWIRDLDGREIRAHHSRLRAFHDSPPYIRRHSNYQELWDPDCMNAVSDASYYSDESFHEFIPGGFSLSDG